jgi:hypothetical protein
MELAGVIVYGDNGWEIPIHYRDGVNDISAWFIEPVPAKPAPTGDTRYEQVSTTTYQLQAHEWVWDAVTVNWVGKWVLVEAYHRPANHGKVVYVLSDPDTISSSTTTYIWTEPAWVIDTVTPHADIVRPATQDNLYWVDMSSYALEYITDFTAYIDNTVPEASWNSSDYLTGGILYDNTSILSTVEILPVTGVYSIHSVGDLYTFDITDGYTITPIDAYVDRPADHDDFVTWEVSTDIHVVHRIHKIYTADLDYPVAWNAADTWTGGQINRLGMTPYHGERRDNEGVIEEYTYSFDITDGWVGDGWNPV